MDIVRRNISLDFARSLAIFAVVMIHVSSQFVESTGVSSGSYVTGVFFDGISRIGVPLFVMISGALFLDEKRTLSIKHLYFHNVRNIILLLIFWSVFYSFISNIMIPIINHDQYELKEFMKDAIMGHYHLWYLFMLTGLYIIIPFLRKLVTKENKNLVLLFLGLCLATQFFSTVLDSLSEYIHILGYIVYVIDELRMHFLYGYTAYFIAGWYIVHIGIKKNVRIFSYLLSIVSLMISILYVISTGDSNYGFSSLNIFIFLYSFGIFTFCTQCFRQRKQSSSAALLIKISKMSFGVYIIHPLFLTIIENYYPYMANPVWYIMVIYIMVLAVSFAFCFVLSKIPVLKMLIRG